MLTGLPPAGKETVVLGMSGGVDSAVAAALLKRAGYHVIGVTLIFWKEDQDEQKRWQDRSCCKIGLARHVAKLLDIPHETIDSQDLFREQIIDDFCETYLKGETPNPCVRCNERMKFGQLYAIAADKKARFIATGHYARTQYQEKGKQWSLIRGADRRKDQTYFLYRLTQAQLSMSLFPLGGMSKDAVYREALTLGLPYEEVLESQEVCFVTQKDYRVFLKEHRPEALAPGPMMTEEGQVIGSHHGIAFYTIGQRRGLGVSSRQRAYVTHIDPQTQTVVIGPRESLSQQALTAHHIVWGGRGDLKTPMRVMAQIRYRTPTTPAMLIPEARDRVRLEFDQPQQGVAPGQSVVFYHEDEILGGGMIAPQS